MKKFLLRTILFLLLATVLMALLDIALTQKLRHHPYHPYATLNDITQGKAATDLIIMGNSRAWVQYDPIILDSVLHTHSYNIGVNGGPFGRQYYHYQLYRKYNPKPRIIIQNIDLRTFVRNEGFEQLQYFPYLLNPYVRKCIIPHERLTLADRCLPFYRYSNLGIQRLFKDTTTLVRGFSAKHYSWSPATNLPDNIRFEKDSRMMQLFEQFLAETQAEGIQVILVYAPIYTLVTKQQSDHKEMWDYYRTLAHRYGDTILNYEEMYICTDTTYFYNRTHLNHLGATIFSRHLAEDLKKIIEE